MKDYVKFISRSDNFAYVNGAANSAERERRKAELKTRFEQSGDSSNVAGVARVAGFSDIADFGNPDGVYPSDDFATFNKKAREFSSIMEIKRLVLADSVKDSIKQYILQRQSVIAANKAKQKEKEKAKQNPNVSKPFWY